ncbi:Hypothetical protein, putative [Bodo saltans]|uniref:Uncharacterized protein n=1 Tax=Bodo saltans TaxID=75058 RepID=A0A0S4JAS5_BODSA|nr:Hypothetical protein, putative [Bodo saltans]|eukprot:CUG87103.1 Hypothetical protein, putative [Bodo saltans]
MLNLVAAEENIHKFKQRQQELDVGNSSLFVGNSNSASPPAFHHVLRSQFSEAPTVDRPAMRSAHLSWYASDPKVDAVRRLQDHHQPAGGGAEERWTAASQATPLGFYRPAHLSGGGEVGAAQKPASSSQFLFDEACERRRVHDDAHQKSDMRIARSDASVPLPWLRKTTLEYVGSSSTPASESAQSQNTTSLYTSAQTTIHADIDELAHDAFLPAQLYDVNPRRSLPTSTDAFLSSPNEPNEAARDSGISEVLGVYQYRNIDIRDQGSHQQYHHHGSRHEETKYRSNHELFYHLSSGAAATNTFLADDSPSPPPSQLSWLTQQSTSVWRPNSTSSSAVPSQSVGSSGHAEGATLFDFPHSSAGGGRTLAAHVRSKALEDLEPQIYPSAMQALQEPKDYSRESTDGLFEKPSTKADNRYVDHQHGNEARRGADAPQRFSPFMTRGSGKVFAR